MNNKSKIRNIKPLAETRYLSLYDAEYINKKGNTRSWTIASRKDIQTLRGQINKEIDERVDAVILVAIHKESKKLVLVKQFRVPINDYVYELPAGLIDGNEEIQSAVKRELKEETGFDLVEIINSNDIKSLYVSVGMTDESIALVYCYCDGEVSSDYLEDDEDLEVVMVDQSEAKELIKGNNKMDIKVHMMLNAFSQLGEGILR